jgi:shikimate dehydrogenase
VRISGKTRLAGVMGWPIDHTLSPAMHNAAYEAIGLSAVYIPLAVPNEAALARVVSAVRVLPFMGFNVTMPFKQAIVPLCDEVAALARIAGAVNAVHCVDGKLVGYNTDGRGLLESLASEAGFAPEGANVVILGAGGAAGSALLAFVVSRAARVTIVNRNVERAEELIGRVAAHLRDTEAAAVEFGEAAAEAVCTADLIVNATPVGMRGEDEPLVSPAWLSARQVVADMVYRPALTPLLREAAAVGARTVGGLGMLVSQGAMSVDIWTGGEHARAPLEVMRAAAEAALMAEHTAEEAR